MRGFRRSKIIGLTGLRWVVLLAAVAYLLVRLGDVILIGPLVAAAETEARQRGIDAVNRIVIGTVGQSLRPEQMVVYEKDQQGRVAAYRINTQLVNEVASHAATAVQGAFRDRTGEPFRIPLGALTGSRLFGSTGPSIPVRLIPIGAVAIDIKQEFSAEGINQTRHRIWLHVTATVQVVMPLVSRQIQVSSDLPLTETVIVGPVPTYLGGEAGQITVPAKP